MEGNRRKRRRSASHEAKGEKRKDGKVGLEREREKATLELGDKCVVEEAERKMDKLEGATRAEEEDVCLIY